MRKLFLLVAMFIFTGCNLDPQSSIENPDQIQSIENHDGLTFIEFTTDRFTLAKSTVAKKFIAKKTGGRLLVTYNWHQDVDDRGDEKDDDDDDDGYDEKVEFKNTSSVKVTLDIPPYALDKDEDLSLVLNENTISGNVDMTFGPHGTVFNKPAILNITAIGLDLKGIDRNKIDIYYYNEDNGVWEKMPREKVYVSIFFGFVRIKNAQLPHFSRYAMAYGK